MIDDNRITLEEHIQRTLTTASNTITRAFRLANDDAKHYRRIHGRYDDTGSHGSDISDPTGNAALLPDYAGEWVKDVVRTIRKLEHLAHVADYRWPAQIRVGETHDGVKVGERANKVDLCVLCGEPAPEVKRIDGQPYHRNSCYFRVYRSRTA